VKHLSSSLIKNQKLGFKSIENGKVKVIEIPEILGINITG